MCIVLFVLILFVVVLVLVEVLVISCFSCSFSFTIIGPGCGEIVGAADLRTESETLDFGGFDSSGVLILGGGILMSIG